MQRKDFRHDFLEEFIYRLNFNNSFLLDIPWYKWAVPCVGFSYDDSRPPKVLEELKTIGEELKNGTFLEEVLK